MLRVLEGRALMFLLRYIFSDDCTYTAYEFVGVFSTKEKAEKAKKPWMRRHNIEPSQGDEWDDITEIKIDEAID